MYDLAVRSKLLYGAIQKAADQKALVLWDLKSAELNIICIPLSHRGFPESVLLVSSSALYWKDQHIRIDQKYLELYKFNQLFQVIWL